MSRYGIAEWFGEPFDRMGPTRRRELARAALDKAGVLACPFQSGGKRCTKKGGVCSIRAGDGPVVITCPQRFDQGNILPRWLAQIVGFEDVYLAREVPFMRSTNTAREAGRIDLVVSQDGDATRWFGLEVQAVYFQGDAMGPEFEALLTDDTPGVPAPMGKRRPDWRSSSAKRLMPQLQVKAPTLMRWNSKLAVAVDMPFFEAVGGPSASPSQDLNDGDIVWLVPRMSGNYRLEPDHWEVLKLDASSEKLLSAKTVRRPDFENALRSKLQRIGGVP
ncbi:MAG: NotI family restriction endonuclease [Boseongicola sp.]|nr:NotI family restriction endonuclease [Boseongicola sp.]